MKILYNKTQLDKRCYREYSIDGYNIRIKSIGDKTSYYFKAKLDFDAKPILKTELYDILLTNKNLFCNRVLSFDELISKIKSIGLWRIIEEKSDLETEEILELFVYHITKLDRLMPFLIDDLVDEIYMDKKGTEIYIDHQIFGRCNTEIILQEEEFDALVTRIKLEHPIWINQSNPSVKIEWQTKKFHSRIAIDFPPLSPNGPTFNIRKLKRKPLQLHDLVKAKTLPSFIAQYLVTMINKRRNITIVGEPNSGKTTLANALDLHTPKHWRKITIEDAIESIDQTEMGYKQLRIQVDSFEVIDKKYTKTSEILRLLHRSPDWIYLGEIQSKEHTQAMFEALNAGLKGIQTTHSDKLEKILRRWENIHSIKPSDFFSLDLIIVMEKNVRTDGIARQIKQIFEIQKNTNEKKQERPNFFKIFERGWDEKRFFEAIKEKEICDFGQKKTVYNK